MYANAGDTAWMLVATALVFFMMPGLALFHGGLVGEKTSSPPLPSPSSPSVSSPDHGQDGRAAGQQRRGGGGNRSRRTCRSRL